MIINYLKTYCQCMAMFTKSIQSLLIFTNEFWYYIGLLFYLTIYVTDKKKLLLCNFIGVYLLCSLLTIKLWGGQFFFLMLSSNYMATSWIQIYLSHTLNKILLIGIFLQTNEFSVSHKNVWCALKWMTIVFHELNLAENVIEHWQVIDDSRK